MFTCNLSCVTSILFNTSHKCPKVVTRLMKTERTSTQTATVFKNKDPCMTWSTDTGANEWTMPNGNFLFLGNAACHCSVFTWSAQLLVLALSSPSFCWLAVLLSTAKAGSAGERTCALTQGPRPTYFTQSVSDTTLLVSRCWTCQSRSQW